MDFSLRVGHPVIWRGSWGTDAPRVVLVTDIEQVREIGDKYGVAVESLPWSTVRAGFAVVSLENGHWAYGYQLEPVTPEALGE